MTLILPNEDQLAIAEGVASYLAGHFPLERFREASVADSSRWQQLAELGLFGIALPESAGGMGLSWMENALACREAGRLLLSPALLGSILGAQVAANGGDTGLCEALLTGRRRVGIAMPVAQQQMQVIAGDDGLCLLVEEHSLSLVEYDRAAPLQQCIDDSVGLQLITTDGLSPLRCEDEQLVCAVHTLVAAMLCGVLEQVCSMAAEYARTRVQFGRPIGAFQAIKHRCADIALATELCWSQTLNAVQALENAAVDARFHALSATLLAGEETLKAARVNIQIHGGMGFTDEVDAHRLLKRAHVLQQLSGDPRLLKSTLLSLELEF